VHEKNVVRAEVPDPSVADDTIRAASCRLCALHDPEAPRRASRDRTSDTAAFHLEGDATSVKCGDRLAAAADQCAAQRRARAEELAQSRRQIAAAEAVERQVLRQLLENWDGPITAMAEGAMAEVVRLRKRLAELLPAGR
jgi:hypothetical protein